MIAAELCQELDKENFVSVTIDASNRKEQGHRRAGTWQGHCPCTFVRGVTGAEVHFYKSIIGTVISQLSSQLESEQYVRT